MTLGIFDILSLVIILLIILNIKLMSSPKTAVIGNRLGSLAMFGAIAVVMISNNVINLPLLAVSMAVGSLFGIFLALKTTTLQIPQLVALLNGFGGGASLFVALTVIFEDGGSLDFTNQLSSLLAIIVGAVTLSGSLIAAAKLDGRMDQRPVLLKGHNMLGWTTLVIFILLTVVSFFVKDHIVLISLVLSLLAIFFGILFTIRIGGADMPVTISLLNSYSGLAASICGFAINNFLLVSVGAIVGASGLILTKIMCKAMNRSLIDVLTGGTSLKKRNGTSPAPVPISTTGNGNASGIESLRNAKKVVIVPGYGMALAQAQWKVKAIYDALEGKNVDVRFAIHPVAGRMPGHMNVLLAEVDIPYEKLIEMDQINPEFKNTDVVIIVGACDVVNPAAMTAAGTPIYGMPILNVHEAKNVIVCNRDTKPGYSGVENSLYSQSNVTMLLGDAKQTLDTVSEAINDNTPSEESKKDDHAVSLNNAKKVVIVPGYGMALAQAQWKVKAIYDALEGKNVDVRFAIHPVAGRMPGHMNVLLAEVDIPYEKLIEMDQINPEFKNTDVVIIVGACDVVNPAAMTAAGTPIYGMPILNVHEAKNVIVCNRDTKPGYSGVENSLYSQSNVTMLLGDAKETLNTIINAI